MCRSWGLAFVVVLVVLVVLVLVVLLVVLVVLVLVVLGCAAAFGVTGIGHTSCITNDLGSTAALVAS
ncbi:hypothetical protein [Streptomyces atratus]|uniref:Uncharacterized protein n=1 Tax=Streptomyces atratus TaxID=1893 RepID=A0A1K2FBI5_STRAR|nr:hypothetical protein [Streptomyces atratus]SFY45103.1 hypothetical protein SAMN02787144_10609 [Streptomyces atratus]